MGDQLDGFALPWWSLERMFLTFVDIVKTIPYICCHWEECALSLCSSRRMVLRLVAIWKNVPYICGHWEQWASYACYHWEECCGLVDIGKGSPYICCCKLLYRCPAFLIPLRSADKWLEYDHTFIHSEVNLWGASRFLMNIELIGQRFQSDWMYAS